VATKRQPKLPVRDDLPQVKDDLERSMPDNACTTYQGKPADALVECSGCRSQKTADQFYRNERMCKPCRKARAAATYNPVYAAEHQRSYRAAHPTATRDQGRRAYTRNPERFRVNSRSYYREHREERQAKSRAWFKAHPLENRLYVQSYRSRRNGKVSRQDVRRMLARFLGRCAYCGAAATTIDHVIPLSRGGRNTIGNLLPACGPCNWSKHDAYLVEWRARGGQA
jgi:5-methylcytosine-specific restriction endonuclease McrA